MLYYTHLTRNYTLYYTCVTHNSILYYTHVTCNGVLCYTCVTCNYMLHYTCVTCNYITQVLDAMNKDSGIPLTSIQVDGGMTQNSLLMQLQADIVGIPVGVFVTNSLCLLHHHLHDVCSCLTVHLR